MAVENHGLGTIMFAPWPVLDEKLRERYGITKEAARPAARRYRAVELTRTLRREHNIASSRKIRFVLRTSNPPDEYEQEVMRVLLNAERLETIPDYKPVKGTPSSPTDWGELYMPLGGVIDVTAERERLDKEIVKLEDELRTVEDKLKNKSFVDRAPAAVVEEHRQRQKDFSAQLAKLKQARQGLS
jgi:valyl-tRNA synthetase